MIYFVQTADNQYVKIGYATDVQKRLGSLQTGSPQPLKLIGTQPGDQPVERKLHERFHHLRRQGEWFETAPALVEYIAQAAALGPAGIRDADPFLRYCVLEPRLLALFVEAATTRAEPGEPFCANATFFAYRQPRERSFKRRICGLVGWEAEWQHPELVTEQAYDVCYDRIYEALPDCRGCACPGIADIVPNAVLRGRR